MKKIFFSVMAIALLSSAAFAAGGKVEVKKHKAATTCPKRCPKTKDCHKGTVCPHTPGCTCS